MLESEESAGALVIEPLSSHDVYFVFGCTATRNGQTATSRTEDRATAAFVRLSETIGLHAGEMWEDAHWTVSPDFLPRAANLFAKPQTTVRTLSALGLRFANGGSLEGPESGGTLSLKLRRDATNSTVACARRSPWMARWIALRTMCIWSSSSWRPSYITATRTRDAGWPRSAQPLRCSP